MDEPESCDRLSRIHTLWTLVQKAHATQKSTGAQEVLLERYRGAVYRYLLGATRDRDAADELFQDFALRFLRGDFRRANATRGRFRDYLKKSLVNLTHDHRRQRRIKAAALNHDPAVESQDEMSAEFDRSWRTELMNQAWTALAAANRNLHTILLTSVQSGGMSAVELATELSQKLGRPMNGGTVRTSLHRARIRFAELLVQEVKRSLESDDPADTEEELRRMGLLKLCSPAISPTTNTTVEPSQ